MTASFNKAIDFYIAVRNGNYNLKEALEWLEENADKKSFFRNTVVYNQNHALEYIYYYSFVYADAYLEFKYYENIGLYVFDSEVSELGEQLLIEEE